MPDELTSPAPTNRTREERIEQALGVILDYAGIDGAHHKQWVLDQVVRALCEDNDDYLAWVATFMNGSDGPSTYEWDTGVAP